MQRKKVLHVVDSLSLGGAQTVLKGFFEKQKENRELFVFSLRNKSTRIEIEHSNVSRFKSSRKYSLKPILALKALVEREEIEVLHTHLLRSHLFGWILKKFFFPKIKLVLHEHGQIFRDNWYYDFLMKKIVKQVDLVIAVSGAAKKKMLQKTAIEGDKIVICYNFVDLERFKAEDKKGESDKSFTVGFVGRLDVVKRIDLLLDAFKAFIEIHKDLQISLIVVGSGPQEQDLKQKTKELGLERLVQFMGKQERVEDFYKKFDVFVLPSKSEACPMSLLEAFATKTPAVVSDIAQLREFAQDPTRALIFESGDVEDLTAKLEFINEGGEQIRENTQRAAEFVKHNSLNNYVAKMQEIYNKL